MKHHPRARYWGYSTYSNYPEETQEHLETTRGSDCYLCGLAWGEEEMEIEHRIPKARGGGDGPDNIAWACKPCNRRKHTMTEEEFVRLLRMEAGDPEYDQ